MWYAVDGVLILNEIVEPALTLIAVPKPWIDGSPAPFTNQSDVGSPGSWFSHATRDNEQPAACAISVRGPTAGSATSATRNTSAKRRRWTARCRSETAEPTANSHFRPPAETCFRQWPRTPLGARNTCQEQFGHMLSQWSQQLPSIRTQKPGRSKRGRFGRPGFGEPASSSRCAACVIRRAADATPAR